MQQSAPFDPAAMPVGQPMPDMGQQPVAAQQPYVGLGSMDDQSQQQEEHPHQKLMRWSDARQTPNIATELDEQTLNAIGARCKREYDLDLATRSEWDEQSQTAMDLAMQVAKTKQFPWPGSSNIVFPLMTTAAIQFHARSYPAFINGRNVVKGVVVGKDNGIPQLGPDGSPVVQMGPQGPVMGPDGQPQIQWAQPPGSKRKRADAIGEHMSWQLLDEMEEWEEETDKLLLILPIIGCAFRKSYFNPALARNVSALVLPQFVVINNGARSVETAPRISEDLKLYPMEIEEAVRGGLFIDHEYGQPEGANGDEDAPHEFVEQHRLLDLDEDGYAEPYIVTFHKQTTKVARIVARYDPDGVHINRKGDVARIDPIQYFTKYDFIPNPKGIYGIGFGQLLGPINAAVNTTLNQLFDAGTLQNTGGGFIGRGLSMQSGSLKFKIGEWKVVNAAGQAIRDNVVPHQFAGPSPVLFQLLGMLIEAGKDVASVKDALTGEAAAATMQPTTLMALIEQGLKVFTAIYKRIYRAAKKEYQKLYDLNRKYLQIQARYRVGDEWKTITQEDYAKGAGVEPISDPAMVSDMQKAAKAQFLMSFISNPMVNQEEILERVFDAAQEPDIDKLIVRQQPPNPMLIAKAAEMELKGHQTEAAIKTEMTNQLKNVTQAILNMANADKAVGDQHVALMEQHVDLLRVHLEALTEPAQKPDGGSPGGLPKGPDGLPMTRHPGLPASPAGLMPGSGDQTAGDGSMAPPFADARQSRNGSWYPGHPATPANVGGL